MNEAQLTSYIKEILKSKNVKEGTCGYGVDGELGDEPAGSHLLKKIKEVLSPETAAKADSIKKAMIGKNRDKLFSKYGKDAEKVAHGRAVNQAKKSSEKEETVNELFGIGGPSHRDKKNKAARARSSNKLANYHDLLRYYQFAIARIPRHKREKATIPQAMHDRYGQEVWDILKKSYPNEGLSETPPLNWKDAAGELIQTFTQDYKRTIRKPFYDIYQELGPKESVGEGYLDQTLVGTVKPKDRGTEPYMTKDGSIIIQDKSKADDFLNLLQQAGIPARTYPSGIIYIKARDDKGNPFPQGKSMAKELFDKYINEELINEDNSYIRVSEPRFVKDKNNPNFLNVYMDYETPEGASIALGKETMSGQIRRESAAEAMFQMNDIASKLENNFNLEDIEVVDMKNGKVRIFAVSDDFIDMDARSELSMALLNESEEENITFFYPSEETFSRKYDVVNLSPYEYSGGNRANAADGQTVLSVISTDPNRYAQKYGTPSDKEIEAYKMVNNSLWDLKRTIPLEAYDKYNFYRYGNGSYSDMGFVYSPKNGFEFYLNTPRSIRHPDEYRNISQEDIDMFNNITSGMMDIASKVKAMGFKTSLNSTPEGYKGSLNERLTAMVREVYSEKQRKWACAQDDPKFDEMCKDTAISKKKKMEEEVTDKEEKKLKKIKKELNKASKMHKSQADKIGKIVKETGMDKAKKNMDMYKDKNRLEELIKAALMGPISEKKQRPDYPDIDGDGDTEEPMVKAAKDKEKAKVLKEDNNDGSQYHIDQIDDDLMYGEFPTPEDVDTYLDNIIQGIERLRIEKKEVIRTVNSGDLDKANESFDSLVKKVDKAKGYTKKEAEKVAGAIAAKKMKGAGKGPTAKQKKRMAETILKELREENQKLTPQEQDIFDDITSSLNEGMFDNVLEKVKKYARKGLMTVALLAALTAPNLGFSQVQQQQLKDVAQTEMPTTEVSRMKKIGIVTSAINNYKRGRNLDKLDDNLKQDLDGVKDDYTKGGIQKINPDQLVNIFDFNTDALQVYVPLAF
jgi:hypothetical protein